MTYPFYPSDAARRALATRLSLPYSGDMQDWEWEVADPGRLAEFVAVYQNEPLDPSQRFSLMEIIIQCVEDFPEGPDRERAWSLVEPLLLAHADLHRATIRYWSCLNLPGSRGAFLVSHKMRRVWSAISAGDGGT